MNATAGFLDKSAEIWAPTRLFLCQHLLRRAFKTSPQNIKLNTTFLGGGFGRRAQVDYVVDAVILSSTKSGEGGLDRRRSGSRRL